MIRIKVQKSQFPVLKGACFVREFSDRNDKPLFFSKRDTPNGNEQPPVERGSITRMEFDRFMGLDGLKIEKKELNGRHIVDYIY
jgi:hypothetical protein